MMSTFPLILSLSLPFHVEIISHRTRSSISLVQYCFHFKNRGYTRRFFQISRAVTILMCTTTFFTGNKFLRATIKHQNIVNSNTFTELSEERSRSTQYMLQTILLEVMPPEKYCSHTSPPLTDADIGEKDWFTELIHFQLWLWSQPNVTTQALLQLPSLKIERLRRNSELDQQ